jgi:hypothetical protein
MPFKSPEARRAYQAAYYQTHKVRILRALKRKRKREDQSADSNSTTVPKMLTSFHRTPVPGVPEGYEPEPR